MISWGLRGNPYQNTRTLGRGRAMNNPMQPQLIIHIVSHSTFLINYL